MCRAAPPVEGARSNQTTLVGRGGKSHHPDSNHATTWQWDWGGFVLKVNGRLTIHLRTGDVRREIVVDDLDVALGEVRTWHAANAVARAA